MSSTSSTSNTKASEQKYEVFLNFRGPDTRAGFTDHLYRRLIDANLRVYKDDEELRKGEEIGPELFEGINKSSIAIPIFSKSYAESKWCLKELIEIMKCWRSRRMKVIPIFYYVTPHEVQNQTGNYEKAFKVHEQSYDEVIIREWKEALSEIGKLSGWEISSDRYSLEGLLVEDVTKEISCTLKKAYLEIPHHLIGLDHHVEKILKMLSLEAHGVQIIGIHGIGGIGKTTLAKVIYNHLIPYFEGSCFLADTRSKGIETLKKEFISNILARTSAKNVDMGSVIVAKRFSNRKVLIVLDDVDEKTQIEDLIGEEDRHDWFGPRSRIIVTTRNKGILGQIKVDKSYELSGMDYFHSLRLFSRHAFQSDNPQANYAILSEKITETTGGLPLALEVIGSSLRNKSMKEWKSKLEKLKSVPAEDVIQKLRISYDELDHRQKHIFLDIACFFIGWDHRIVIHFWDPRKFYTEEAIDVLQQKSLIKIDDNLLWMHDQLRDLGREIVREGNILEPESQSRLWNQEEATEIFMTKRGTEKIQGIHVKLSEKSYQYLTEEAFAKMPNVRLFWDIKPPHKQKDLDYLNWSSSATPCKFLPKKPYNFSKLRWLSWHEFPYKYIETSNFSLLDLTILDFSHSDFTIDWAGWSHIKMAKNLKVLNLTGCQNLVKTPEFSSHMLLEQLILKECTKLIKIDKSIGMLEHLVHLNLNGCSSLQELPTELSCMESLTELLINDTNIVEIPQWRPMVKLEVLSAYGCKLLKNFTSFINLRSLKKLSLEDTPIILMPDSIGELVNLSELRLCHCDFLKKLPESIGGLVSLIQLDISFSNIEELPNSTGCLNNLKILRMRNTSIAKLPYTIGMARKLEEIDAKGCKFCGLPMLPESLIKLTFSPTYMQTIPDLSNLINLMQLMVDVDKWDLRTSLLKELALVKSPSPWWIGRLSKAEKLDLAFPTITTLHPDVGTLSQLKKLVLKHCHQLKTIPQLPSNLAMLVISDCGSLEAISDLSHLKKLHTLEVVDTPLIKLESLHSLDLLQMLRLDGCMFSEIDEFSENLRDLVITKCRKLKKLPQMSNLKKLENFTLWDSPDLVEIRGRLESLKSLWIWNCESLVKIPDVLNVKTVRHLRILCCPKLCNIHIDHKGPILMDNLSTSESEQSLLSIMFRICGNSENTMSEDKEVEGKGKEIMEVP